MDCQAEASPIRLNGDGPAMFRRQLASNVERRTANEEWRTKNGDRAPCSGEWISRNPIIGDGADPDFLADRQRNR
jgi:hypothetical protein